VRPPTGEDGQSIFPVLMLPDLRNSNPYQRLLESELAKLGIKVCFPQGYRRGLPLTRALLGAHPRVRLVHLHWISPLLKGQFSLLKAAYAAKIVADVRITRRLGTRLVWTVHNLISHDSSMPRIELWCHRQIARAVDIIIVHDTGAKGLVSDLYGVERYRIRVIPHGDYINSYLPPLSVEQARARLKLPANVQVFLFFGMIRPYKGLLNLLSAWKSAFGLDLSRYLLIAGEVADPTHRDEIIAAAQQFANVRLDLQFVPDDEVSCYFSAADAIVLPFKESLTSGSVVLAASFEKPLIAPLLPSITSVVGHDSPYLYDPADPEGLATALGALAASPRSDPRPRRLPNWAESATAHLAAYQQALSDICTQGADR
jgi:beta-1,4-mannosyltransferase